MNNQFDRGHLDRILQAISGGKGKWRSRHLCLFAAAIPPSPCRLMVIGRAVNGYDVPVIVDRLGTAEERAELICGAYAESNRDRADPLAWVEQLRSPRSEYNTATSAFWRVDRELGRSAEVRGSADVAWHTGVAWSNLYKVAPLKKGNPSTSLRKAQEQMAMRLLQAEIEFAKPGVVVFLTGWNWAEPALKDLPTRLDLKEPPSVEAVRVLPSGALAIVCPHPQGKVEAPIVEAVRSIVRAIRPLR